jgi:hypothetical protein
MNNCPVKRFRNIVEKNISDYGYATSTLIYYNPDNIINSIKNLIFTEWLRLTIYFHKKCEYCKSN